MIKKILFIALIIAFASCQCDGEQVQFGNKCWDLGTLQDCHTHLDNLSEATQDNPSITNECVNDVDASNKTFYTVTISYNNPYFHDATCNEQAVSFQGASLPEGDSDNYNEWEFDNQQITFKVLHEDIDGENAYNCQKETFDEYYVWVCEMQLDILLGGAVQLEYNFHLQITLDRVYDNVLEITVVPNEVQGDCCVNELGIVTILQFCDNFNCDNYLGDGEIVERKQDIYVEHSIVSPEFQYYYLNGLSLKLGPIIPDIIATNGSLLYRYRWHFQSNIAMPGMTIEAVSRISEYPVARRRALQSTDVGEDYQVKGTATITIGDYQEKQDQLEQEKSVNGILIGVLATVGALLFLGMVGAGLYCLKVKKSKGLPEQAAKYEQKNTTSSADNTLKSENSV